jgi:hypothetical protein
MSTDVNRFECSIAICSIEKEGDPVSELANMLLFLDLVTWRQHPHHTNQLTVKRNPIAIQRKFAKQAVESWH